MPVLCRLWLTVLVLSCALPAQGRSVISGRLLGCDGRPIRKAQVHLIVPWEKPDRMILASADAAPDGAFRLTFARTGLLMAYFTGVDHRAFHIPLIIEKPLTLTVSARLSSYPVPRDLEGVGIIGDFNAFSQYASLKMQKQPDGTFSCQFEVGAPTFAYQIVGPFGPGGAAAAINGTQSDEEVFDTKDFSSYVSVVRTPGDGKIRIAFDPGKLRVCPSDAKFRFKGERILERFARISMNAEQRVESIRSAKTGRERSGHGGSDVRAGWAADIDDIRLGILREKELLIRQALIVAYLRVAQEAGVPLDPALCRRALDEIPPTSALWDLDPWILHPAGLASGRLDRYDAYLEEALERNPDPNLKAAMLYGELVTANDPERARRYLDRLAREYPDSRFTESAQFTFSPDKNIRTGRKLPSFSLPSLAGPSILITNSSLRNKFVLLDFWATWCVVCVGEMPYIHDAYAKYQKSHLEILSLSLDKKAGNIALFRRTRWPMPWLHAFVEGGYESQIAKTFELDSLPRLILVDPEGTIVALDDELRGPNLDATLSRFLIKPEKQSLVSLIAPAAGAISKEDPAGPRLTKPESALDRKVHIEEKLITEMPAAGRWCDRIPLEKRRVDIGGCELYVEEEGQGVPLVLINGGPGGTHHCFHPWFSRAKGFARVIYYDQRGCGLSDWKPGPGYSVEQAVEDLEYLRRALGISRWAVLGYSYGGFLAQYYALRFPENVAGLVLVSAMPGMRIEMKPSRELDYLSKEEITRLQAVREEIDALLREKKITKDRALELLLFNNTLNGYWKRQDFYRPSNERAAQMALYEWKNDDDFNSILSESVARVDLAGAFEHCPIPTLICEGRWDLTWNTDKPGLILKNHPRARLVTFERSGHNIYEDEPDKFFKLLEGFIGRLPTIPAGQFGDYRDTVSGWMSRARRGR